MSSSARDSAPTSRVNAVSGTTSSSDSALTAMSTPPPLVPSTEATASPAPSLHTSAHRSASATATAQPPAWLSSPQPPRHAPLFHVDPTADGGGGIAADQYVERHLRPGYVFSETLLRSKATAATATAAAAAAAAAPSGGGAVADRVEDAEASLHAPDTIVSPPSSSWGSPAASPSPALDGGAGSGLPPLPASGSRGGVDEIASAAAASTTRTSSRPVTVATTTAGGSTAPVSPDSMFDPGESGTPGPAAAAAAGRDFEGKHSDPHAATTAVAVAAPTALQLVRVPTSDDASASGTPKVTSSANTLGSGVMTATAATMPSVSVATRPADTGGAGAAPVRATALQRVSSDGLFRTTSRASSDAAAADAPAAASTAAPAGSTAAAPRSASTTSTCVSDEATSLLGAAAAPTAAGGRVTWAVARLPTPHLRSEASASGSATPSPAPAAAGSPTSHAGSPTAARPPHVTLTGLSTSRLHATAAANAGTLSGSTRALLGVSDTSSQAGSPLTPHDDTGAAAAATGAGAAAALCGRREKRRPPSLFAGSPTTLSPTTSTARPMLAPPALGRVDDRSPTSTSATTTAAAAAAAAAAGTVQHASHAGLVWTAMSPSLPGAAAGTAVVLSPAGLAQRPLVLPGGVASPTRSSATALSLPSPPSHALVSLVSPALPDSDERAAESPMTSAAAAAGAAAGAAAPALLVEGLPSTPPAAHAPTVSAAGQGRPPFIFSPMTSPPLRAAAAARPVFAAAAGATPPLQRERAGSDAACSLSGSRGSGGPVGPGTATAHAGLGFTPPALAAHPAPHFGGGGGGSLGSANTSALASHYGAGSFGAGSPGGGSGAAHNKSDSASPVSSFSPLAAAGGAGRVAPPALAASRPAAGRPPQSPSSPSMHTTTTTTVTSAAGGGPMPAPLPTRRRAPPPSLFRPQRSPSSQPLPAGPPPGLPKSPATAATPTTAAERSSPVSGVPRSTTSRAGATTTTTTTTTAGRSSSLHLSPPLQARSPALTGASSSVSDLVNTTSSTAADRAGTSLAGGAGVSTTSAAAPSMRAGAPPFGARHGSVHQNLNTLASTTSRGGGGGGGGGGPGSSSGSGGLVRISHDRRALVAGMFRVSRDGCLTVRNMLLLNPTRIDAVGSPGGGGGGGPTSGLGTHGSFMMGSAPAVGVGGAAGGMGSMSTGGGGGGGRPVQLLRPQRSASGYSPVSIGATGTGRMPLLGGTGGGAATLTSPSTGGPEWYSPHTYDAGAAGAGGGGGGVGGGVGGAATGSVNPRGPQHHFQPSLHHPPPPQQMSGYGNMANASFTLFSTSMDTPFSPITYSMDSQRLAFPSPLGGPGHSERGGGAPGQLLRAARDDTAASHYLGGTASPAHALPPASAVMPLLQPMNAQPHHPQHHLQPQRQHSISLPGPAHGTELHASPTRPGGSGLLGGVAPQSATPVITPNTSTTPGRLMGGSGAGGGGGGLGNSTTSSARAPLRRQLSVGGGHLLPSANAASPPALATVGSVGSLFGGGGPFTVTDTASSLLMPYADIPVWRSGPAGVGPGNAAGMTGYVGSPAVHVNPGGFRGLGTGAMTPTPYVAAAAMSSSGTTQNTPCTPMPPNVVLLRDLEILSTAVGEGASATVFVSIHKPTGRRLAVKRVDLAPLCLGSTSPYLRSGAPSNGRVNQLQHIVIRELQVLHLTYRSPFMVKVYNAFFLAELPALDIVMEFMHYGSLDHLADCLQKHARAVRESQQQRLRLLPDSDDDLDGNDDTLAGGEVVARGGGLCDSLGGPSPSATPLGPDTRDAAVRFDTAAEGADNDGADTQRSSSNFISAKLPDFQQTVAERAQQQQAAATASTAASTSAAAPPRKFSLVGTQSNASNSVSVNASRSNARTTGNSGGGGGGSGLGAGLVDGTASAGGGGGGGGGGAAGGLRGGVHEALLDSGPEDSISVKSDCGSEGDVEPDDGSGVVEEVFGVTERLVAVVGEQLLRGVRDMHSRGYVHRDIKPGNVLVNEHGVVKLSDFGLSQRCDDTGAGIKNPSMSFVPPVSAAPTRMNTPLQSPSMVALQVTNPRARRPPFLHGSNLTAQLGMKRGSGPLAMGGGGSGVCGDPASPDAVGPGGGEALMAMSCSTTNSLVAQRDGMDVLETECTSSDDDEAGRGGNWNGGRSASSSSSDDAAANCSGTDKYMSPERQRGERHGKPADIWAVGVTLAEFAIGEYPYDLKDIIDEFDRVSRLDRPVDVLRFNAHRAVPLSFVFADFCRLATLPAASQRPTAQELLEHPFFKQWHRPFNLKDYLATRVPVPSNQLKEEYLAKLRGHPSEGTPPSSQAFSAVASASGA